MNPLRAIMTVSLLCVPWPAGDASPGLLRALDVLAFITVQNEHQDGYDRDLFPERRDSDGDGCATRAEVLIRESITEPSIDDDCRVVAGLWRSIYDGLLSTDPADIDIDHVVALKEAWDSGAWQWTTDRRGDYANDLLDVRTLRAVTSSSNSAKGEKDPSNWLPSNEGAVCRYLSDWIAIKARWGLTMDQSEFGRIRNVLEDRCPDQTLAPWRG